MTVARLNYYMLVLAVVLPALLYVLRIPAQALYGIVGVLVLLAFVSVSYLIQSNLKTTKDANERRHLRRQMKIIMIFIGAGIISSVHSIVRYHVQSEAISSIVAVATWLVYAWGVGYLVFGIAKCLRRA